MSAPEVDPKLLPARDGDAPLHELSLDQLSALLYMAFTGEELLRLLRELRVAARGGYRLEAMGELARADLLADELRAVPGSRGPVLALLREAYEFPALEAVVLPKLVAEELSALAVEPDASVRLLWRLLADPSPEIRGAAAIGLEALADEFFSEAEQADKPAAEAPSTAPAPHDDSETRELRKTARRVGAQAEHAREKNAELKEQLRAARAEIVRLERESAARAKEKARLADDLEKTRGKLSAARAKGGVEALEKAEKARAELAARVAVLDEKVREAHEARDHAEAQLAASKKEHESQQKRPAEPRPGEAEEPALEANPSTWLFPRFSREFYDSLEGWDPRIQRAAFKQAYLLAENHRHPSLRAIPLEGIPGYYRVRIATDVRLIYRRTENEREVEILSLIDREDLDRYVRQAKTR